MDVHVAQPSFYRSTVAKGVGQVKLEWVRDTAFRFFPVLPDEQLGYRLHDADLAINKDLALANRSEVRDALDMIDLDREVLSLAAGVCAACGKDPGFTPDLMLDLIQRHINFSPDALAAEALTSPVDPKQLKMSLLSLLGAARTTLANISPDDLGYLYVDKATTEVVKSLHNVDLNRLTRHAGTVKGSWPRIVDP